VAGHALTWPANIFGDNDAVGPACWCQDDSIEVGRLVAVEELSVAKRELALAVASEIYSKFGWYDPPVERLKNEQRRKFGPV
jgi:hypothetical protein